MKANKQLTRKEFLKGMGYTVAGVAVATSIGGTLTGCSTTANVDTEQAPEWPFIYKKIDPATAEARAHKAYNEQGG